MEEIDIKVFVLGSENPVAVSVPPDVSVTELSKAIQAADSSKLYKPETYKLVFNGKHLTGKSRISSYALKNGSKLIAFPVFDDGGGSVELDLVFVVDTTGSMGSYIKQVQANIIAIADSLVALESAMINFALIGYKDIGDHMSIQAFGFSASLKDMKAEVDKMTASGGGDAPEMMATGLDHATRLQYRPNATKICVLITDAPPHGIELSGDSHPNGDPGAPDLLKTVRRLGAMGVVMYSIGCEPSISSYTRSICFMKWAADTCRGKYISLTQPEILSSVILAGCREEINRDRLLRFMLEAKEEMREDGTWPAEKGLIRAQKFASLFQSRRLTTIEMIFENREPQCDEMQFFHKHDTLQEVKAALGSRTPAINYVGSNAAQAKATCKSVPVSIEHVNEVLARRKALKALRAGSAASNMNAAGAGGAPAGIMAQAYDRVVNIFK